MRLFRSIALFTLALLASALTGPATATGGGHCERQERYGHRAPSSSGAPVWTT
jgi:hypothetical protein